MVSYIEELTDKQVEIRKEKEKLKPLAKRRDFDNAWVAIDYNYSPAQRKVSPTLAFINLLNKVELMKTKIKQCQLKAVEDRKNMMAIETTVDNMTDYLKNRLRVK